MNEKGNKQKRIQKYLNLITLKNFAYDFLILCFPINSTQLM